jgi:hypothetical protein
MPITGRDIDQQVQRVESVIATARRHLANGKMVDLSALESRVRRLCGMIEVAVPEPEPTRAAVDTILDDLGRLGSELTEQYDKVRMASTDAGLVHQAHKLYRNPPGDEG